MREERDPWVYVGDEPDPRYSLANERTFLAWVRTVLAVMAGAVALESLGIPDRPWLRTALVVVMLLAAAATAALACVRWARVERAMRTGAPLPRFGLGPVVTIGLVVVALFLMVVFLVS